MATLTDNPSFTANEIYELDQSDPVEGAGVGASFGGLGKDNQPHQQLANRTSLAMQLINQLTGWVTMLLSWMGLFTSSLGVNGYLTIGVADIALGSKKLFVQWGFYNLPLTADGNYDIAMPTQFPTACLFALAACSHSSGDPRGGNVSMQTVSRGQNSCRFESNWTGTGAVVEDGFFWLAIGY